MSLLNRKNAPSVIRLYDACFKQGVIDAYDLDDNLTAKEFLEQRLRDWHLCTLDKQEYSDWKSFVFTLYWWARRRHMTQFAENCIFKIRTKNYLWALLPYCLRFYLMGIQEWLDYPNPVNIEVFKTLPRVHWSPHAEVQKFVPGDYFSHMHDFAYEYRQLPEEQREIGAAALDEFCKGVYDLTRVYGRKKR